MIAQLFQIFELRSSIEFTLLLFLLNIYIGLY